MYSRTLQKRADELVADELRARQPVWEALATLWLAGFDTEWLLQRCRDQARHKRAPCHRLKVWMQRPIVRFFTAQYWSRITPIVLATRATERPVRGT